MASSLLGRLSKQSVNLIKSTSRNVITFNPTRQLSSQPTQDMTYIEIPIPRYAARADETFAQKKARLVYQSRKRGIKETDLLLSTFCHKYLESMAVQEVAEYDRLINTPSNDWDIYYWATGVEQVPEEFDGPVMRKLKEHTSNGEKEARYKQPELPVS